MNRTNKLLALMLVGAFAFTGCNKQTDQNDNAKTKTVETESSEIKTISGEQLDKIQENNDDKEKYLVIDTRDIKDYKEGHVKHAITLPASEIDQRIDDYADYKEKNVVVYGQKADDAEKAYNKLAENGFTNLSSAGAYSDFDYTSKTKITSVTGPEFIELVNTGEYTIIDVRDEKDYNKGHLAGAINVPVDQAEELIDTLPKDKAFLVHCYSGNRSFKVADLLANKGHEAINALDGTKEYDGYDLSSK